MGRNLKKKISRRSLVKKLDAIFSKYIRARDGGKCVMCGSSEQLTNGHLFSRVAYSTRWSELNCHAQCWRENYRHEFDYYPYEQWFKNKYGEERYHELHRQFVTPRKFKDFQLQEMIDEYTEKLKTLNTSD